MANTINYDESKHKELEAELTKINDNFENLISELSNLQDSVTNNLKGKATTSLVEEISLLISKLTSEKENWSQVTSNANKLEKLIKEADEALQKQIDSSGAW